MCPQNSPLPAAKMLCGAWLQPACLLSSSVVPAVPHVQTEVTTLVGIILFFL